MAHHNNAYLDSISIPELSNVSQIQSYQNSSRFCCEETAEKRSPSPSPCGISDLSEKITDFIPQGKIPLPSRERSSWKHGFKQSCP